MDGVTVRREAIMNDDKTATMRKPLAKNEPARFQCGKCWTEHEAEWTIEKVTPDA